MTDSDRERLERASQHPTCKLALQREASDYFWPAMLLGLFYLALPLLMALPFLLAPTAEIKVYALVMAVESVWAIPFVIVALRAWRLRQLPARQLLGLVVGRAQRQPGAWVTLETLDAAPLDLRLRLKAYLESTGGAVGAGSVGVALCRGDQLLEWVPIPDDDVDVIDAASVDVTASPTASPATDASDPPGASGGGGGTPAPQP